MIHETEQDRKNEMEIANLVATEWGYRARRFEKFSRIDFGLVAPTQRQRVWGWLECKDRSGIMDSINTFESVMLSADKFVALREWGIAYRLQSWFAIRSADREVHITPILETFGPDVYWGGRTKQTRSKKDIEPVIYIPTNMFRRIKVAQPSVYQDRFAW